LPLRSPGEPGAIDARDARHDGEHAGSRIGKRAHVDGDAHGRIADAGLEPLLVG
jgi:hypothetical protein